MGTRVGSFASAADSFKVEVFGRGGHASQPHRTIDPVVLASHIVVRLQTVVSRGMQHFLLLYYTFHLRFRHKFRVSAISISGMKDPHLSSSHALGMNIY